MIKRTRTLFSLIFALTLLLVGEPLIYAQRTARSSAPTASTASTQRGQRGQQSRPRPAPRPAPRPSPRPAPRPAPSRPAPSRPSSQRPSSQRPSRPAPSRPAPSRPTPSRPAPSRPTQSRPTPSRPARSTPSRSTPSRTTPSRTTPSRPSAQPSRPAPSRPAAQPNRGIDRSRNAAPTRYDSSRGATRTPGERVRYTAPTTPSRGRDATRGNTASSNTARDSRGRYVRIDQNGRAAERRDGAAPVVDLSGARPQPKQRASFPSLSNSRRARDRSTPSKRFAPVEGESLRPQLERLREDRLRNSTRSPERTRVTRDSILKRYREPSGAEAVSKRSLDSRAAAREADRAGLRRADDVRQRTEERRRSADRSKNAERSRAREAGRTASSNAARAAARDASRVKRKNIANETARKRLATLDRLDPQKSSRVIRGSVATARAVDRSVRTSLRASFGAFGYGGYGSFANGRGYGGGYGGWYGDFTNPGIRSNWFQNCYWPAWNSWYFGSGLWCRSGFGGFGGFGYNWGWGGFGFGYRSRNFGFCYQPYWNTWSCYQPYASWYCPRPIYYTNLWIDNDPVVAAQPAEEEWVEEAPAGEGWIDEGAPLAGGDPGGISVSGGGAAPTAQSEALSRAASHYLTVGDRAFREGRFGDAVHFYAKAVEFSPDDGVLFLILSDALFATGDYHYGAYALRRALELDPTLTEAVVDKHSFYEDEREFDRQLAVLEEYLEDHFLDDDARLLLAANYLFGGRPAAAVDLLSSAFSKSVLESQAGGMIFATASVVQFGEAPAEAEDASGK